LRERRNRKQRARLITLLAVITAAGNFRLAQVLQQARYSSRLGLEGCGICSLFGAVGVVCAPIDRWPHPPRIRAAAPGMAVHDGDPRAGGRAGDLASSEPVVVPGDHQALAELPVRRRPRRSRGHGDAVPTGLHQAPPQEKP